MNRLVRLVFNSLAHHSNYFTRERESTSEDQPPHKKQRTSCLFVSYKNSLPSRPTSINCEAQFVKYLNAFNEPGLSADDEPNICRLPRLSTYVCDLYLPPFLNTCKLGTGQENFFSMRPHRARILDNLLETLEYLKCN